MGLRMEENTTISPTGAVLLVVSASEGLAAAQGLLVGDVLTKVGADAPVRPGTTLAECAAMFRSRSTPRPLTVEFARRVPIIEGGE